ncbi:60S ribosomal export protein NMD3 [Microtus ochrogaster]|uniref:60S ribosomal export protein NMD3 n=1 Tax=Microtus ochrogaster TaxID=79684 RepID=A0A8J6GF40_MICOH|nr:60S ribosomal export protein NMD3 [Microtus ochrogaster]
MDRYKWTGDLLLLNSTDNSWKLFLFSLFLVRLVDACFVWTEPHSKRLKVKLTIQKEVMNGAILQQVFVVDYVVQSQMCGDCHRVEAKDFWKAVIQVRQKDNVVCLSPKLAQSLGNMSQICICIRVTSAIHLIDPNTLQVADIDGNMFWSHPFNSLCHPKQLEEFIVMECSIVRDLKRSAGAGVLSKKVLIKKSYDRTKRQRRRNWKLKELARDREDMDTDDERQYQDFLEDLEEDEAIRKNVNIYRDSTIPVESDTDDEGAPRISLAEMIEDLHISQDATGEEGAVAGLQQRAPVPAADTQHDDGTVMSPAVALRTYLMSAWVPGYWLDLESVLADAFKNISTEKRGKGRIPRYEACSRVSAQLLPMLAKHDSIGGFEPGNCCKAQNREA